MPQDVERDEFVAATLPLLIGACERSEANSGWCRTHFAYFKQSSDVCADYVDHDDLADRLIEAWQGRPQ